MEMDIMDMTIDTRQLKLQYVWCKARRMNDMLCAVLISKIWIVLAITYVVVSFYLFFNDFFFCFLFFFKFFVLKFEIFFEKYFFLFYFIFSKNKGWIDTRSAAAAAVYEWVHVPPVAAAVTAAGRGYGC
jgi:hypothetical protein